MAPRTAILDLADDLVVKHVRLGRLYHRVGTGEPTGQSIANFCTNHGYLELISAIACIQATGGQRVNRMVLKNGPRSTWCNVILCKSRQHATTMVINQLKYTDRSKRERERSKDQAIS